MPSILTYPLRLFRRMYHRAKGDLLAERGAFYFFDGEKYRNADILRAWIAFSNHREFKPERHLSLVDDGSKEAMALTARAVREVLKIGTIEQRGLTDLECVWLLQDFYFRCTLIDKPFKPGQTTNTNSTPAKA